MNARDLVGLGLPQQCVGVAFEALKASGLISHPAEAARRIAELIVAAPEFFGRSAFRRIGQICADVRTHLKQPRILGPQSARHSFHVRAVGRA